MSMESSASQKLFTFTMKPVFGTPGIRSGLALRISQCFFAIASVVVMASSTGFSSVTFFCYLMSKWFGDAQKLVSAVFSLDYKLQLAIIFIDEVDSFLGKIVTNSIVFFLKFIHTLPPASICYRRSPPATTCCH